MTRIAIAVPIALIATWYLAPGVKFVLRVLSSVFPSGSSVGELDPTIILGSIIAFGLLYVAVKITFFAVALVGLCLVLSRLGVRPEASEPAIEEDAEKYNARVKSRGFE